ncbi:hypothetical protein F5887DRAFT_149371 [Amanita rubescens]|nr:hypothetical protein F5887DRAFT_149371 [Amanita rubescens]
MARVGWIAFFMARVVIQASVSSWRGFSGDHGDTRDFQARDIYLRRWRGNGYTRDGPGGALLLAAFPAEAAAIQGHAAHVCIEDAMLPLPAILTNDPCLCCYVRYEALECLPSDHVTRSGGPQPTSG